MPGIDKSMMIEIDIVALRIADGLVAATRFGDHFHVGLLVDQQPQALSHRGVILDQYNAQRSVHRRPPLSLSLGPFRNKLNHGCVS